jgi:predicted nucleic acid-binding protein
MDKVVIDTSAWIESLRPESEEGLHHLVKDLIMSGQVLIPGIIRVELLRGARNRKEYDRLDNLLEGLTYLPVPEELWASTE